MYYSDELVAAMLITCRNVANKLKTVSLKCNMYFIFLSRQELNSKKCAYFNLK